MFDVVVVQMLLKLAPIFRLTCSLTYPNILYHFGRRALRRGLRRRFFRQSPDFKALCGLNQLVEILFRDLHLTRVDEVDEALKGGQGDVVGENHGRSFARVVQKQTLQ